VVLSICDLAGVPKIVINPQHTSLGRALLAALTFHVNWLEARTGYLPGAWDVLWSLSVEEVFYVFFPLLCTFLRRQALLIALLFCFVLIGPFARVRTHNELWADYGYLACMDGIALGCLAALVSAKIKLGNKANLALRIFGVLLCLFITVFRGTAARLGLYKIGLDVTALEVGAALLVIALQQRFEARGVPNQPTGDSTRRVTIARTISEAFFRSTAFLRWFGRNSYEVYLTHMLVVWPMVGLFFYFHQSINRSALWFLATTALTGIVGYAVARFYSEPLNRALRARFAPAASKRATVAAD
jgi:peptidoglycan/LPS O-acetylase OafA/YrhL